MRSVAFCRLPTSSSAPPSELRPERPRQPVQTGTLVREALVRLSVAVEMMELIACSPFARLNDLAGTRSRPAASVGTMNRAVALQPLIHFLRHSARTSRQANQYVK